MSYFFTSESVSEGHPDKLCDQISDAILDAFLTLDPRSRVAAECFATTGLVLVGGEIRSTGTVDIQSLVRQTIRNVGYTDAAYGIDADSCAVLTTLHEQSSDIAQGVDDGVGLFTSQGAGDQGMMFGYAGSQTPELMPLPIALSHRLMETLAKIRRSGHLPYLRPDAKAQVTVEYEGLAPIRLHTVVISTQHDPDVDQKKISQDMIEMIRSEIPPQFIDQNTQFFVNPTGRFVIGGPHGDTGLTGRKIIVDTYGGWAPHGGGAFSGKDSTKVDRSGAYMARYIAKNIVAADLAQEIEIQLAYAIGVAEPVSVMVNSKGTGKISDDQLVRLVRENFDLTPAGIIRTLSLQQPIFAKTACYGHFGREHLGFSWEKTDVAERLKRTSLAAQVV